MKTRWFQKRTDEMPEYKAYQMAKYRCTNPRCPSFKDYGGRGIEFRFTSFKQFFALLGPRPEGMSLDRIENDGHYEPGNVRWATPSQQQNNVRAEQKAKKVSQAFKGVPWTEARRRALCA